MSWGERGEPATRKEVVGHLQDTYGISQRRACRVVPVSRKAVNYTPTRPPRDAELMKRLRALAEQYPRYGYLPPKVFEKQAA